MAGPAIPAALKTAVQTSVKAFDDIVAKRGGVAGKTSPASGQALQSSTGLTARSPGGAEASASSRPRISLKDAVGMAQQKLAPGAFSEASRSPDSSPPQSPSLAHQAMMPFQHAAHQVANSFIPPAFQNHMMPGGGMPLGHGGNPLSNPTMLDTHGQGILNEMRQEQNQSLAMQRQITQMTNEGMLEKARIDNESEAVKGVAKGIAGSMKKVNEVSQ